MLASHMIAVGKKDKSIISELEAKGHPCIGVAKALTADMHFFSLDVNETLPVDNDNRVNTYIISIPDKPNEPYRILYSAHPDRGVVDCDLRGNHGR